MEKLSVGHIINMIGWIVIIIIFLILLRTCNFKDLKKNYDEIVTDTIVKYDTTIIRYGYPVYTQPQIITDTIIDITILIKYLPSEDNEILRKQYNDLVNKFVATKTYTDTLRLDTLKNIKGYIAINDSIRENNLLRRRYDFKIEQFDVTKTLEITKSIYKNKRIVYGGIKVGAWQNLNINTISAGFLYKDRKNNIFSLSQGYIFGLNVPNTELGYYKIISLK